MHSSRDTSSVLRVRDLKHPLKNVFLQQILGLGKICARSVFLLSAALISSPAKSLRVPLCLKLGVC